MTQRCTQCASELETGATVCTYCGAENTVVSPPDGAPPAQAVPASAVVAEPPAADTTADIAVPFGASLLDDDRHLEGIGGWLILVAIGLVISPLMILGSSAKAFLPLLSNAAVQAYLQDHPGLNALMFFELASNGIFLLLLCALNYLFFKKKRAFPTFMVFYLALQLVVVLIDLGAAHALMPNHHASERSFTTLGRAIIGVVVWIPYLLVSRRVKVTFVN